MFLIEEHVISKSEDTPRADTKFQDWETVLAKLGQSPSLAKAKLLSDRAISRESIYRDPYSISSHR